MTHGFMNTVVSQIVGFLKYIIKNIVKIWSFGNEVNMSVRS
jgi:hypothetical protein